MRVSWKNKTPNLVLLTSSFTDNISVRIVEYATRDQAQNAVSTLSNQNLMGRLVYVREVTTNLLAAHFWGTGAKMDSRIVRPSRDSTRPAAVGVAMVVALALAAAWATAVVPAPAPVPVPVLAVTAVVLGAAMNANSTSLTYALLHTKKRDAGAHTDFVHQLPYTVGWQDLKDLFRQAGKAYP